MAGVEVVLDEKTKDVIESSSTATHIEDRQLRLKGEFVVGCRHKALK